MDLRDFITIFLSIFGAAISARIVWHFQPRVAKETDKSTLDNLVAEAAKKAREELDWYLKTLEKSLQGLRRQNQAQEAGMANLAAQNKDQQEQINQLRLESVEKQGQIDNLRADQEEIRAAFEALEWSVRQEPGEIADRIETRASERRGKKP